MPLDKRATIGTWIKDFKKSDAPQFKGKNEKDRRDMAIAAYLNKEGYRSGHGSGSGTVHGGKHNDPAFQALMKKHGVTHKLVGPKNNKAAKLIGSPDNIRKVLQSEEVEKVKAPVGQRPKGIGWSLHSSGQQTGKHDVWKRTTKKVAAPKFNKEEKGRGPTGIAYSVKKGHPDAENPSTRKKYPERQTPEYKKKFFGKVEKESVEMKTFFQLRESMKCH